MPIQMRWNIPSTVTALTPCRLLRFASEQTVAGDSPALLARLAQDEIGRRAWVATAPMGTSAVLALQARVGRVAEGAYHMGC